MRGCCDGCTSWDYVECSWFVDEFRLWKRNGKLIEVLFEFVSVIVEWFVRCGVNDGVEDCDVLFCSVLCGSEWRTALAASVYDIVE